MSRSPVMANDISYRKEFKEKALQRVQVALKLTAKTEQKPSPARGISIKGLEPKLRKEE